MFTRIAYRKMTQQTFFSTSNLPWFDVEQFFGTQMLSLAEPVPGGSIHRLRMKKGTTIPVHSHPCDEYVYVLEGRVQTGQQVCEAGTFWHTPTQVEQGPHLAITDVELLTIRLGAMGHFNDT